MSSNEHQPQRTSVRLSTLNPQVREKLVKFDTGNDGELTIEEAIQGLVTLQKQSNNYKRMLYFIVPLMTIMLACVLGVNILAIQLTKDLRTSTMTGNSVLTNTHGKVLATSTYSNSVDLLDWLMYYDVSNMEHIQIDDFSTKVNSLYLEEQTNITRFYINTNMLYFYIGSDGTYDIDFNEGYNTNRFALKAINVVEQELKNIQERIIGLQSKTIVSMDRRSITKPIVKVIVNEQPPKTESPPTPRFGCKLIPTRC